MRIKAIRTTILAVPLVEPEISSRIRRYGQNILFVEVETDTGLVGYGETPGQPSVEAMKAMVDAAAPEIIGRDPHDIEGLNVLWNRGLGWQCYRNFGNFGLCAVEIACWDIIGKAAGRPVAALLGGALQPRISCFGYLFGETPEQMGQAAARAAGQGFEILYCKVGLGYDRDLARVRAIREAAGPGVRLRLDANQAWTVSEAVRHLRALAAFDIEFIEQPLHDRDFSGVAQLRRGVPGLVVAANESAWTEYDVMELIRQQAADVIVTSPHQVGGLLNFRKTAGAADLAGLPVVRHSHGELGVGAAAALHVLSTLSNTLGGHQFYVGHIAQDVVAAPGITIERGTIAVPTGPGLGVTIDHARLDVHAERYRRDGAFLRNAPKQGPAPSVTGGKPFAGRSSGR